MEWPLDFQGELARRIELEQATSRNPIMIQGAKMLYASSPVAFVNDCVYVYEPRNANRNEPVRIPAVPFPRQRDFINWMHERFQTRISAPVEKSRDSGATWMAAAFSVWMWLYHPGSAVGFGSRKEDLVDQFGDMGSIFEKIRSIIRHLPHYIKPEGLKEKAHFAHMRILNPENQASIVGEAGNNIGRGGRTSLYFIDEAAYIERPQMIEASLTANTDCRIDISSPRVGTLFNEWMVSSPHKFVFDVSDAPWHTPEWIKTKELDLEAKGLGHIFRQEYLRDATAGITGQLIPGQWVEAAVDAHIKLGIKATGGRRAGLDVADGGTDRNSLAIHHGIVVTYVKSEPKMLADEAGRWAYGEARMRNCEKLLYDSIGVGAGAAAALRDIKSRRETAATKSKERAQRLASYILNRSKRQFSTIKGAEASMSDNGFWRIDVTLMSRRLSLVGKPYKDMDCAGWSASGAVVNPNSKYEGNRANSDMFSNAKSQAWWLLRDRFLATYKSVVKGEPIDPDDIISLSSEIAELRELKSELSQITYAHNNAGKVVINKTPDGHRSPNLADSVMISFAPSAGIQFLGIF